MTFARIVFKSQKTLTSEFWIEDVMELMRYCKENFHARTHTRTHTDTERVLGKVHITDLHTSEHTAGILLPSAIYMLQWLLFLKKYKLKMGLKFDVLLHDISNHNSQNNYTDN